MTPDFRGLSRLALSVWRPRRRPALPGDGRLAVVALVLSPLWGSALLWAVWEGVKWVTN